MRMKRVRWIGVLLVAAAMTAVADETVPVVSNEVARLRELRERNPQRYEEELCRLRGSFEGKMRRLREEDPEAFRALRRQLWQRQQRKRMHSAERRREEIERRLAQLKEKNPALYEELLERRARWREEMRARKRGGPGGRVMEGRRMQTFREQHPAQFEEMQRRRKQARDERAREERRADEAQPARP
jgi:hypothetical protein